MLMSGHRPFPLGTQQTAIVMSTCVPTVSYHPPNFPFALRLEHLVQEWSENFLSALRFLPSNAIRHLQDWTSLGAPPNLWFVFISAMKVDHGCQSGNSTLEVNCGDCGRRERDCGGQATVSHAVGVEPSVARRGRQTWNGSVPPAREANGANRRRREAGGLRAPAPGRLAGSGIA